jgi:hypothetical protein
MTFADYVLKEQEILDKVRSEENILPYSNSEKYYNNMLKEQKSLLNRMEKLRNDVKPFDTSLDFFDKNGKYIGNELNKSSLDCLVSSSSEKKEESVIYLF